MRNADDVSTGKQFKIAASMKIGYVSLNVSDLGRSLEFYQSILGFKSVARPSHRALLSAEAGLPQLIELQQVKIDKSNNSPARRAGLYHFAILLPERKHLADMLLNLTSKTGQVHFEGLADHLVSESIYIRDPDYIGIEIYRDRPIDRWKRNGRAGRIQMATLPIDTDSLLKESTDKGWKDMPPNTSIGHVHLHVTGIDNAMKFYHDILGLNLTATIPSAAFFAAGQYHHHIGANTWLGAGISKANPQGVGLNHFSIVLEGKKEYEAVGAQLSRHSFSVDQDSDGSFLVSDLDQIGIRIQHG